MPKINQTVFTGSGDYVKGDELPHDHPLVRQAPELFDFDDSPIERATSAPGEKRAVKRPAKKA